MSSVAEKLQRKSQRPVATKQVRLKLVYIDLWSAVKLAFVVSIAMGVVLVVASIMIWVVLESTNVFDAVDGILREILAEDTFTVGSAFSLVNVALFTLVVAAMNVVIGTALGAIASMLYNYTVRLTGGLLVGFTNQ